MKLKCLTIAVASVALAATAAGQTTATPGDGVDVLLRRLEQAIGSGEPSEYLALLSPGADRSAATTFTAENIQPGVTRAVVRERARTPVEEAAAGEGYELVVEVFIETGSTARLGTWQLDVRIGGSEISPRGQPPGDGEWRIAAQESIDTVEGLNRLALNPSKHYVARDLVVTSEDLTLEVPEGSAFVAETDAGVTALVVIGDGEMRFTPRPAAERGQVRIFSGSETLQTQFTGAFIRFSPQAFGSHVTTRALTERRVDRRELDRATDVFNEFVGKTFSLDLGDLSDEIWSLTPGAGDFLADVRTRRFETLTYAQSSNQPEDITVYDREDQRIIALYTSAAKLAARGRYYGENDLLPYDVLDYSIDASFRPEGLERDSLRARPVLTGCWIEGRARLAIRIKAFSLSTLTLRLADPLAVTSVTSTRFGPLLHFRLVGQNNVIVNFPSAVPVGTELTLVVSYAGLLPAQELDENWIGIRRLVFDEGDVPFGIGAPRYIYSNQSFWYPQATVTDYATATLRLTVPADFAVVASGDPVPDTPTVLPGAAADKRYTFVTLQPARYLSCLITRLWPNDSPARRVTLGGSRDPGGAPDPARVGVFYESLALSVEANRRSRERVGDFANRAADILHFYTSLIGDFPYPTFTLALTDSRLPGGHSPAYFAVLNQPLPTHPSFMVSWRTDPVSFSSYPSFFLAHELAHQWWGQAVSGKNYHEQWLSEGLAQYFAALNAQREGGDEVFADVLDQMHRWAMRHSDEGPIYLGYRLGHLQEEPRIFRALVYNKAAMVLHMLRRLIGDERFFRGLRRFYAESRFQKVGTDDLRRAFETETQASLERFFERWIHEAELPRLRFTHRTAPRAPGTQTAQGAPAQAGGMDAILRFEQEAEIFDVPVTVTLVYRVGPPEEVIVPVTEKVTEMRVALAGELRRVDVNRDHTALAHIER